MLSPPFNVTLALIMTSPVGLAVVTCLPIFKVVAMYCLSDVTVSFCIYAVVGYCMYGI